MVWFINSIPATIIAGRVGGCVQAILEYESSFGGRRKGNRGRGATGKVPVFRILERKGEGFWSWTKERLIKHHGVSKEQFPLSLKELDFRYNNRSLDIFDPVATLLPVSRFSEMFWRTTLQLPSFRFPLKSAFRYR